MIDPTDADIGRKVVYRTAPDFKAEEGVISSFSELYVWVKYRAGETAQATQRKDLEWLVPAAIPVLRRACGPFEVCRAPGATDGGHDWAVLTKIGDKLVCVAEFFEVVDRDEHLDAEHHARLFAAIPALVSAIKACKHGAEYPDELGDIIVAALKLAGEEA